MAKERGPGIRKINPLSDRYDVISGKLIFRPACFYIPWVLFYSYLQDGEMYYALLRSFVVPPSIVMEFTKLMEYIDIVYANFQEKKKHVIVVICVYRDMISVLKQFWA